MECNCNISQFNVVHLNGCASFKPKTSDLSGLTIKEIGLLPASVLGPIIRQAHQDSGANEMSLEALKQAIDVVRRGHWVPGLPKSSYNQSGLDDLFGG